MISTLLAGAVALQLSLAASGAKTVGAFVVGSDSAGQAQALKLQSYVADALETFPTLKLRRAEELFGMPQDSAAQAQVASAERDYQDAVSALDGRRYDDAERLLKSALREFGTGAAALRRCGHYCDATALYAATLHRRGETEEAKSALMDLLALSPQLELSGSHYSKSFQHFRASLAHARRAAHRGTLTVRTAPPGARLYVDGDFLGFTPQTLSSIATGKHLLRVEAPGFSQQGQLVEVRPEDQDLHLELVATAAYQDAEGVLRQLADAAPGEQASLATQTGRKLGLQRVVTGVVHENALGADELELAVYDVATGKRLGTRQMSYQGDDYGELKKEVARSVNALINNVEAGPAPEVHSSDPLAHHRGTEDWNAEDQGGNQTQQDKKGGKGDPLDHKDGMENW